MHRFKLQCSANGSFAPIPEENIVRTIEKLILYYAQFNLPTKMTVLVLAKKYNIPIPEALKSPKKKKSKYNQKQI